MQKKEIQVEIRTEDEETLEARLVRASINEYAVICHPHPLFGGTMDNNVVLAAQDAVLKIGLGALRFNFRGAGRSTGHFGDGEGEALDIMAACRYLKDELDSEEIRVAAYSFGVFAFLKAVKKGLIAASVALISPPVTFMDFRELCLPDCPCLIVVGDSDQYCAASDLNKWLASQKERTGPLARVTIPGTDHFFCGSEKALTNELTAFWPKTT